MLGARRDREERNVAPPRRSHCARAWGAPDRSATARAIRGATDRGSDRERRDQPVPGSKLQKGTNPQIGLVPLLIRGVIATAAVRTPVSCLLPFLRASGP